LKRGEALVKSIWYYDYPVGVIAIAETDGAISNVFFGDDNRMGLEMAQTPLIQKAAAQLREYFAGQRTDFTLPLSFSGTEFQQSVWQALQTIALGETRSYKEIALQIGKPKAVRAVGMANKRNPISIIVPCHRVVGHDGSLTGYAGGLSMKQYLLELEQKTSVVHP
jgi:methylated-DNA-[protein]-cysteine S-methyltransferase